MSGLDAVKAATWALHTQAERSGIVADIIAGKATRLGVALFWRNLLPIYQALDASPMGRPDLARTAAIEADLHILASDEALSELPEAATYAGRIKQADSAALIGHAYVRYLGDVNGGRIMQRRLQISLGDLARGLRFHAYPGIADLPGFAASYRAELDGLTQSVSVAAVVAEAVAAFEMNIALSEAIRLAARHRQSLDPNGR